MNHLLVSVCIITYNSSDFVLETLESIKKQTYKELELIISDDCSSDRTVSVCSDWILQNKDRFVNVKLITSPKNTGVSANCNRAVECATGEWVKLLAGDDILFSNSIENYCSYVQKNNCEICYAKMEIFGDVDQASIKKVKHYFEKYYYPYLKKDLKSQQREILKRLYIPGPGLFYKKDLWENISKYDEEYPFCEEYPFTCKLLLNNKQIHFIDNFLVSYRLRMGSLSHQKLGMSPLVFCDFKKFFFNYRRSELIKRGYIFWAWNESISLFSKTIKYKYSTNPFISKLSNILYLFSPLFYVTVCRKFLKSL